MFIFHHTGSMIIPTADERLQQELIQFCTYAVSYHQIQPNPVKILAGADLAGFP